MRTPTGDSACARCHTHCWLCPRASHCRASRPSSEGPGAGSALPVVAATAAWGSALREPGSRLSAPPARLLSSSPGPRPRSQAPTPTPRPRPACRAPEPRGIAPPLGLLALPASAPAQDTQRAPSNGRRAMAPRRSSRPLGRDDTAGRSRELAGGAGRGAVARTRGARGRAWAGGGAGKPAPRPVRSGPGTPVRAAAASCLLPASEGPSRIRGCAWQRRSAHTDRPGRARLRLSGPLGAAFPASCPARPAPQAKPARQAKQRCPALPRRPVARLCQPSHSQP